ncbi:GNAT family N-acetyltransferase [Lacticaseibacillus yichunensis]|uniref:GNAT family N-acetyltransferase n=1 Tax=Lacticaseibacillus yichunensis TaxID=2486015 RepID=A0ABW4CRN9_9LACO|nr:GNAT family N-acetyltransferase [Lacticaseibacillus yichunensis]
MLSDGKIQIRPFQVADAAAFFAYASDPAVTTPAGMAPLTTMDEAVATVTRYRQEHTDHAIVFRGQVVGHIGVYPRANDPADPAFMTREIGYALGQPFWGQGLMTAAVRLVCADLFARQITEIWAGVFPDNARSVRLLRHTGFHYQFTVPLPASLYGKTASEEAYYCLLPENWASKK